MNSSEPIILDMMCQLTIPYELGRNLVEDRGFFEEILYLLEFGLMTENHHGVAGLNL